MVAFMSCDPVLPECIFPMGIAPAAGVGGAVCAETAPESSKIAVNAVRRSDIEGRDWLRFMWDSCCGKVEGRLGEHTAFFGHGIRNGR